MTQERLKEIIRLLAQPGFRLVYDGAMSDGEVCGPGTTVLTEEINYMGRNGWLKGMPSGRGSWLSDEGRKAFLRSTDELGDGRLAIADESNK